MSAAGVLAGVALAAPLAGLLAGAPGATARSTVVAAGRAGAATAAVLWVAVLALEGAPTFGDFTPDDVAVAAMAGLALCAAGQARGGGAAALIAPPVAAAGALVIGLVPEPAALDRHEAIALVAGGAVVAGVAVLPSARLGLLAAPAALLAVLRGAGELADPPQALPVGLAVAALAAAGLPRWRPWDTRATALALAAAAAAVAPVAAARPAGGLLAAAAVLTAVLPGQRWILAAAAPGAVAAATALADIPVPAGPDPGVHAAVAAALALTAAALVALPPARRPAPAAATAEVTGIATVLAGWLLLAPSSWRWTGTDGIAGWERAAAVAVAAGLAAATADRLRALRRGGGPAPPRY